MRTASSLSKSNIITLISFILIEIFILLYHLKVNYIILLGEAVRNYTVDYFSSIERIKLMDKFVIDQGFSEITGIVICAIVITVVGIILSLIYDYNKQKIIINHKDLFIYFGVLIFLFISGKFIFSSFNTEEEFWGIRRKDIGTSFFVLSSEALHYFFIFYLSGLPLRVC